MAMRIHALPHVVMHGAVQVNSIKEALLWQLETAFR